MPLPDGIVAFVKSDCETCRLVEPLLAELQSEDESFRVLSQSGCDFPGLGEQVVDDSELEASFRAGVEIVPTLLRVENGREVERIVGWDRIRWRALFGDESLGNNLPEQRPGCASRTTDPDLREALRLKFDQPFHSRSVPLGDLEDDLEACFDRGWSDGLPVVPPTPERVLRMLDGTSRAASEVVALIPPNKNECTVEKAALNAVLAGCRPEYLPTVLAAVEAACEDQFCLHGILATTHHVGPVIIVNGPVIRSIGMNSGVNVLGQGNRANATIGRALQLIVRNVGGGRPGEVDRAVQGNPGKLGFCLAEDESRSPWESLAEERGFDSSSSTVTLFAGEGVRSVVDQMSRKPESLAGTFAACLRTVVHPKIPMVTDALLVVCPEHAGVFRKAGWSKKRLRTEIEGRLLLPGEEIARGAGGIAEGVPPHMLAPRMPKFRPGGLMIVHAGGTAGMFSSIVGGWVNSGPRGTQPVTREIQA